MSPRATFRLWSATKRITMALLVIWLLLNVLGAWFARDLDRLMAIGFPIDFWIAAQGMLPLYLLIIVVYVFAMERMESRHVDSDLSAGDDDTETS